MTPQEFMKIQAHERKKIGAIQAYIDGCREFAERCPPPANLRPATARDIVCDAIIWYKPDPKFDEEWYWKVVEEVLYPSDDWKAYTSDDGCRYGLHRAYVEDPR